MIFKHDTVVFDLEAVNTNSIELMTALHRQYRVIIISVLKEKERDSTHAWLESVGVDMEGNLLVMRENDNGMLDEDFRDYAMKQIRESGYKVLLHFTEHENSMFRTQDDLI